MNAFVKVAVASFVATSLFAGWNRADPPAPPRIPVNPITFEQLGQRLAELNLDPKVLTENASEVPRYEVTAKKGNWTFKLEVEVSSDKQYVWIRAPLMPVSDRTKLLSEHLQSLRIANEQMKTMRFHLIGDRMYLSAYHSSDGMNAATLKQWMNDVQDNLISTYSRWVVVTN